MVVSGTVKVHKATEVGPRDVGLVGASRVQTLTHYRG